MPRQGPSPNASPKYATDTVTVFVTGADSVGPQSAVTQSLRADTELYLLEDAYRQDQPLFNQMISFYGYACFVVITIII